MSAPPNKRLSRKEKRQLRDSNLSEKINFNLQEVVPLTENQKITFNAYNNGKHLMLHGIA